MLLSVLFSVKNILPQALLLVLFMCPISFYNEPLQKVEKNLKKGVDESQLPVLYYDSRADEGHTERKRAVSH